MYLVIDVGGTNTRLATAEGDQLLDILRFDTEHEFDAAISSITTQVQQLAGNEKAKCLVVGIPGPLDSEKSHVLTAPNLKGWNMKPLRDALSEALHMPVHLENDADLAGLGEAMFGAGRGHRIVVYLTISTGVGSTRIVDGRIDTFAAGFEAGHQIINFDSDVMCGCGQAGHLEAYVSGTGFTKRFGYKPTEETDPKRWDDIARELAYGLNNVAVHWSPHCIVLGGPMMKDIPIEKVRQDLRDINSIFPDLPAIKHAERGDDVGLYGGLAHATQLYAD